MKKILALALLGLAMSITASATNPVVSFVKHPALVTHTVKGAKAVAKVTYKGAKATAKYSVKVLF